MIFLDIALALNLLVLAGLKVLSYKYTLAFKSASEHISFLSKILYPFRSILAKFSPWLLSKTFGGVSLLVFAENSFRIK